MGFSQGQGNVRGSYIKGALSQLFIYLFIIITVSEIVLWSVKREVIFFICMDR